MSQGKIMKISFAGAILLAGFFLVLASSTPLPEMENVSPGESNCCIKENCESNGGEMLWESLPRQFISSINIIN